MRKVCFPALLSLFIIFSNVSIAQSGKISGKVINTSSGQAMASATVILIEKSQTQIADQEGNFSFSKLTDGNYSIRCSYAGYNEKIIDSIIIRNQEIVSVTISLEEKKAMDNVVIKTSGLRAMEAMNNQMILHRNCKEKGL